MAIHVSDRTPSRLQYEDSFKTLYADIRQRMERVPKRRQATVARPILRAMNNAYDQVLRIEEDPIRGTRTAATVRYNRITAAMAKLAAVEKPLWIWWNICGDDTETEMKDFPERKRANLCEKFNQVMGLLRDMERESSRHDPEKEGKVLTIRYYTENEIQKAEFLTRLRELHRMTHGKVAKLGGIWRDAEGEVLIRLADAAWYEAVRGNQLRTDIPAEREERRRAFHLALSALEMMQRPMIAVFTLGGYSNREMREWVNLLQRSYRLLAAVQKSGGRAG